MGAPSAAARIAVIDEFGELSRKIALMKPDVDRHKSLKDAIESWYEFEAPERSFVASGRAYDVQVSARAKQRKLVDPGKLFTALGREQFISHAKVALEVIDRLVPGAAEMGILAEARTGNRSVKPVARAAIAAAPKKKAA